MHPIFILWIHAAHLSVLGLCFSYILSYRFRTDIFAALHIWDLGGPTYKDMPDHATHASILLSMYGTRFVRRVVVGTASA
jgi:hypothetical protein